ncbi:ABC transporter permease [Ruicaihuangia caeni]|uniref:ABC transporter permease n=1 Tax=Ruicaihuangia caeni TaxID=3042517 RepID=A0AAW6TD46_9MICO|nr:ABC transporter permease [Klugiella sp. YN-L-19]MDI2099315.1 ABC transporter permease [Klugiella sp. YN-L-19]
MRHLRVEPWLLVLPVVVLLLIGFVLPVGTVLLSSVTTTGGGWTLENFSRFFESSFHLGAAWRSIRLAVIQTIVVLVISLPLAYVMTRVSARVQAFMMIAIVLPLMTSVVVRSFGWVILLGPAGPLADIPGFLQLSRTNQGLLGTELGINIAMVQVLIPFAVLSILGVLNGVDRRLEEASRTMGASFARTFGNVILPLSVPGLIAGGTLVFAMSISSFITPNLIGGAQIPVVASIIYTDATTNLNWPFAAAQSVLMLIVVLATIGITSKLAARNR